MERRMKLNGLHWQRPESDKEEPFIYPIKATGTSLDDQIGVQEKSIQNIAIALNELFKRIEGLEKRGK